MSRTVSLTLIDRCISCLKDGDLDISTKIARVMNNLLDIQEMVRRLEDPKK